MNKPVLQELAAYCLACFCKGTARTTGRGTGLGLTWRWTWDRRWRYGGSCTEGDQPIGGGHYQLSAPGSQACNDIVLAFKGIYYRSRQRARKDLGTVSGS